MKNRKLFALLLVLVMLLSLAGCAASSGGSKSNGQAYDAGYGMEVSNRAPAEIYDKEMELKEEITADSTALKNDSVAQTPALPENRKLIQTVRMTVETEDMDGLLAQLNTEISALSGYVGNQEIYNGSNYSGRRSRSASITIRIPAANVNSFVSKVSEVSNVVSSNTAVEDVTLTYVSTESRMKALQTEESRLLELLAKAENMDDLLTIERRLTEVRSEIERVGSTLRLYDNLVDYATVHLSVSEVKEYTVPVEEPETVGERIRTGWKETMEDLKEGFEDFFVDLVVNFPYLLIWALVLTGIIILIVRHRKKKAKKRAEQAKKTDTP